MQTPLFVCIFLFWFIVDADKLYLCDHFSAFPSDTLGNLNKIHFHNLNPHNFGSLFCGTYSHASQWSRKALSSRSRTQGHILGFNMSHDHSFNLSGRGTYSWGSTRFHCQRLLHAPP